MKRILLIAGCAIVAINGAIFTVALVLTCLGGPSATYHGPGIVLNPPIPKVSAPVTVTKAPPIKVGHTLRVVKHLLG